MGCLTIVKRFETQPTFEVGAALQVESEHQLHLDDLQLGREGEGGRERRERVSRGGNACKDDRSRPRHKLCLCPAAHSKGAVRQQMMAATP